MITRLPVFSLVCLFFMVSAVQHPTGFITLKECVQQGAEATYVLQENGEKQFVLILENGVVVDEGGIVTHDGKILTDTETYKQDQQRLLRGKRDISKEKIMVFDGALAVMSCPGQQCYYHWLLQALPRLKILSDSQHAYDKIYVYADNVNYHWQKDAVYTVMDYLDISRDKLLFVEADTIVQAKKLLVPSVPWLPSKPGFWDVTLEWYKEFFKDVFVRKAQQTPRHIFISRSKAHYRRISNETVLMELLSTTQGFVSYCLEDLSIREQATLFNNAEVIVGPHGAGWTNLIFCKPGTKIIEIDHGLKGEQRSSFKGMAEYMDCLYYPFYTDLLEQTDCPENIHDPINQDITVDVAEFDKFLQQLGVMSTSNITVHAKN